jgi:hypothetical protein
VETQQSQEKENYKNGRRIDNEISLHEFANWNLYYKLGSYPLMEVGKEFLSPGVQRRIHSFGILEFSHTGFILSYCTLLLTQGDTSRIHHIYTKNCLAYLWNILSYLTLASHSLIFNIIFHSENR